MQKVCVPVQGGTPRFGVVHPENSKATPNWDGFANSVSLILLLTQYRRELFNIVLQLAVKLFK